MVPQAALGTWAINGLAVEIFKTDAINRIIDHNGKLVEAKLCKRRVYCSDSMVQNMGIFSRQEEYYCLKINTYLQCSKACV
jgi:hypothetical protein